MQHTSVLDENSIRGDLSLAAARGISAIHIFPQLDSTNRWLLQEGQCAEVCLAEQQTAGRGRRGRQWQSPPSVNLYLSLCWCFERAPRHLPVLSLVTGLAVAEALHDSGITGHGLKWPNDIFHQDKKLGGILLEAVGSLARVVVGIGLNVNMPLDKDAGIDQPWSSLQDIVSHPLERNPLVAAVLNRLIPRLEMFPGMDMLEFRREWAAWDVLCGRQIKVLADEKIVEGIATGINSHGQLLLKLDDGAIKEFSSADVSVRM